MTEKMRLVEEARSGSVHTSSLLDDPSVLLNGVLVVDQLTDGSRRQTSPVLTEGSSEKGGWQILRAGCCDVISRPDDGHVSVLDVRIVCETHFLFFQQSMWKKKIFLRICKNVENNFIYFSIQPSTKVKSDYCDLCVIF